GVGNENKAGPACQIVADLLKQLDTTRPREVSEMAADKFGTELSDSHYTAPPAIEKAAQRAKESGHPQIYCENPNVWDVRLGAELWKLKMIYSPIQVQAKLDESSTPTAAVLAVTNRYSFTDLSTCETAWTLLKGDKQVAMGTTHAALAPRASGKVKLDLPAGA